MALSPDATPWKPYAGRWVAALTVRGLVAGLAHVAVAAVISAAIQSGEGVGDLLGSLSVAGPIGAIGAIGAVVGVVLATIIGVITAPAAVAAAVRGSWGRTRPWVIGLPAAATVVAAVAIAPPWPTEPVDPFVLSDFLASVVWLYAGPAAWVGLMLHQLAGRWTR